MELDSSSHFMSSLSKFLHTLCNGYVDFTTSAHISGTLYVDVDGPIGEVTKFVVNEKVYKIAENDVNILSKSSHSKFQKETKTIDNYASFFGNNSNSKFQEVTSYLWNTEIEELYRTGSAQKLPQGSNGGLVTNESQTSKSNSISIDKSMDDRPHSLINFDKTVCTSSFSDYKADNKSDNKTKSEKIEILTDDIKRLEEGDTSSLFHSENDNGSEFGQFGNLPDELTLNSNEEENAETDEAYMTSDKPSKCSCTCGHGKKERVKYTCEKCGKSLSSKYNLKIHLQRLHQMPSNLKCTICDKEFSRRSYLEAHAYKHMDGQPRQHLCDECPKSYAYEKDLHYHKVQCHGVHSDWKCKVCGMNFFNRYLLKRHSCLRRFSAEKKLLCEIDDCQLRFKTKKGLRKHMKLAHHTAL